MDFNIEQRLKEAHEKFDDLLRSFIVGFTGNKEEAIVFLKMNFDSIMKEVWIRKAQPGSMAEMPIMLDEARKRILPIMRKKAGYQESDCPESEGLKFFPLEGPHITDLHLKIFCLAYYKGLTMVAICNQLNLTSSNAKNYLQEAIKHINGNFPIRLMTFNSLP